MRLTSSDAAPCPKKQIYRESKKKGEIGMHTIDFLKKGENLSFFLLLHFDLKINDNIKNTQLNKYI